MALLALLAPIHVSVQADSSGGADLLADHVDLPERLKWILARMN
jgi:hypothetical protein